MGIFDIFSRKESTNDSEQIICDTYEQAVKMLSNGGKYSQGYYAKGLPNGKYILTHEEVERKTYNQEKREKWISELSGNGKYSGIKTSTSVGAGKVYNNYNDNYKGFDSSALFKK